MDAALADGVVPGVSEQRAAAAAAAGLVPPVVAQVEQPAEAAPTGHVPHTSRKRSGRRVPLAQSSQRAPGRVSVVLLVRLQRLVPLVDVEG